MTELGQIPNSWFSHRPACRNCGQRNLTTRHMPDPIPGGITVTWCPNCWLARTAWGHEWTMTPDGGWEEPVWE